MKEKIQESFEKLFGENPFLFRSPGRINLIGEHTDYNDGFVLPAAIDLAIWFAVKPNDTNEYRFYAFDLGEHYSQPTGSLKPVEIHWANYLLGVISQFVKDRKTVPGFDCVFGGNIPAGAGMSSSAAIESGLAYALNHIFNVGYSTLDLVKFSQKAEHEFAGVRCGIMDQFAVMFGRKGHALKLDCRTLDYEYYPLDFQEHLWVLVDTGVKHSLASSEYNERRQQCRAGVEVLRRYDSHIAALRDVSPEMLELYKSELDPVVFKRCAFVINENMRVQRSCKALLEHDYEEFGKQMYSSHVGLRDEYEVSCAELDQLVEIARSTDGVLGARMMGGGFGGCTLNLVKKPDVSAFREMVTSGYQTPAGEHPEIYEVQIDRGTVYLKN
ncbi:MAG: galactokinase [Chlorobi bacterium]|nr:galactokinase [Chlorobiota bacterium]